MKREFRKLFYVTRDLKVLCEPWRTQVYYCYSWFYYSILRDFVTQVLQMVIQTSIESDWYAICNMERWLDFVFFKHCPYCKNRSLKRVFYLLFFVNWENEIVMYVIGDPLFFLFVNCARDPPVRPSCYSTSVDNMCFFWLVSTGFETVWYVV